MSSSDSQPPLTRRQARERERAAETGAQPVTPEAAVAAGVPASVASAADGPRSVAVPSAPPAAPTDLPRRRPGSHVAPAASAPAQAAAVPVRGGVADQGAAEPTQRAAVQPSRADDAAPPASATEIVPGTGMTRRQLRALREAEQHRDQAPVPLRTPSPQSSDRTVADVLGDVAALEGQRIAAEHDEPAPDAAVLHQATEADGSPDAIEPLSDAVAHSDEPRVHRSTWAPPAPEPDAPLPEAEPIVDIVPAGDADAVHDDEAAGRDDTARGDRAARGAGDVPDARDAGAARPRSASGAAEGIDASTDDVLDPALPAASTPNVFPLDLSDAAGSPTAADARTEERRPASPASAGRARPAAARGGAAPEPPATTGTIATPTGHWSRQAEAADEHLHDPQTGQSRATQTQTNALILPNSALSDVTGALNATGEVIITGSIDLPKTLAATGAHTPHIDGVEVDRLLEQHDAETATNDAVPVRASRAVSSHTSTRAVVLAAAKPKQSKVPTALAYSAAGVGVAGVIAVVVAMFSLGVF
ncbi:hypothetical protein [Curtobacterium sp. MCBD17_019]|uniref:hypothetical protein n=1 Tax=Curtobacterium sp. MCBD17_019 TaxID=2175669 RepID=UPI000DA8AE5B|nr:hypothetical protein [Curtobacterium sp. MCBD17_019]PZE73616.1 hypothetical protein DEI82_13450 [Curtobacterium sp. MCBD17_019]